MAKAMLLVLLLLAASLVGLTHASYNITRINVNVFLNPNTSAHVNETVNVSISPDSVRQYTTNRAALNLTLSKWQALLGPSIVQHIINQKGSIYNFDFLPGPVVHASTGYYAYLVMSYDVNNATSVNQTTPRVFVYTFNPAVFNFENGASGEILNPNTTLTLSIPSGSRIESVYPLPDVPASGIANNYKNITSVSWLSGEPLSRFKFIFVISESLRTEVTRFLASVYYAFGTGSYAIIAGIIIVLVLYVYYRASRNR